MERFKGGLYVDNYAGFEPSTGKGDVVLAACWSHARRRFYEMAQVTSAPIAPEAPRRMAELSTIEADIHGQSPAGSRHALITPVYPQGDAVSLTFGPVHRERFPIGRRQGDFHRSETFLWMRTLCRQRNTRDPGLLGQNASDRELSGVSPSLPPQFLGDGSNSGGLDTKAHIPVWGQHPTGLFPITWKVPRHLFNS